MKTIKVIQCLVLIFMISSNAVALSPFENAASDFTKKELEREEATSEQREKEVAAEIKAIAVLKSVKKSTKQGPSVKKIDEQGTGCQIFPPGVEFFDEPLFLEGKMNIDGKGRVLERLENDPDDELFGPRKIAHDYFRGDGYRVLIEYVKKMSSQTSSL